MLNPFSDLVQVPLAGLAAKVPFMKETFKERMRRLRLRAGLDSQKAAAKAIGCERGTVGMWEAPSSAVDSVGSEYLLAVAAAYRVRPGYINTGEGSDEFPWHSATAPEQGSQLVRLDPAMLAETHKACRIFAERQGRVFSVETDPARFLQVYLDRQSLSSEPSQDELIEFGSRLASIMAPQGAVTDGRNDGVPTAGTDERKVAGRGGRRKT
jgi:transcriptional regulator with XRE-family HTH domain